jgi:subtilisin family serine protease
MAMAGAAAGWLLLSVIPAAAQAGDDPRRAEQWNLTQIGAPEAWATSTGAGVTIGIVDSGIDAGHPDLADQIVGQADCVDGPCRDGSAPDGLGHGTAVSGVAAASTGNGVGIAGVAPDAKLLVARVLDDDGEGDPVDISSGIRWVVDHGAKVVSLSLGDPAAIFSASGNSIEPAIQYAWSRGAIPVLAAGNYNRGVLGVGSPGYGNLNAVVVGATDRTGGMSFYSSPLGNAKWGVVAPGGNDEGPGEDILSTELGGDYAWHAGTSLAVPAVSGALALLLAQGLGQQAAVDRLLATLDTSQPCGAGCRGRVRVDAAVAIAAADGPDSNNPSASGPTEDSDGSGGIPVGLLVAGAVVVVAGLAAAAALGLRSTRR